MIIWNFLLLKKFMENVMKYRVYTSYCLEVEANSQEEAERKAQEDIAKREGISGNWVWCEDFDGILI